MLRVGRPRTSSRWNVTDAVVVRPLVRPAFLRWSIVVFVLLVPFVVHAIWDYAESSRLAKNIAAIRDHHEPVSAYAMDSRPRPLGGELAAAERFYGAAGVLADRTRTTSAGGCRYGLPTPNAMVGGLTPLWPT